MDFGFYTLAGKWLKLVIEGKSTVKNIVFSANIRRKACMMAILSETYKYRGVLEELIDRAGLTGLLNSHSNCRKSPYYILKEEFMIALHEYLWSKELNSDTNEAKKKLKVFLAHYHLLAQNKTRLASEWTRYKLRNNIKCKEDLIPENVKLLKTVPKYCRINGLLPNAKKHVVDTLVANGYLFLKPDSTLETLFKDNSEEKLVYFDSLISDLLIFAPGERLFNSELVNDGYLIIQDKASCFPAFILNPPQGSTVLDACAAPGNKTSHLASLVGSNGHVIAVEKDAKRFKTLKKMCGNARICSKMLSLFNYDFLKVDFNSAPFADVEYIVVDPSCSGSGMLSRLDNSFEESPSDDTCKLRLEQLSKFQVHALSHALRFPKVKEVVYSTCSIHREENELVVAEILEKFNGKFKLSDNVMPAWKHRGYVISNRLTAAQAECLVRANPVEDKCNGFFVAKFERT